MSLSISEKVKVILKRRGMTMGDLAQELGQSRQNLSNKLSRDNFNESEAREIARVLKCEFDPMFTMTDSGEKI